MIDARGISEFRARQIQLLILYAACALPLIVSGAFEALQSNANSPLDWVPASFAPRAIYNQHSQIFGHGDVVVASWPGCTVDEPRLDDFLHTLRTASEFQLADGSCCFERIVCGREVLGKLTNGPQPISREEAASRLRGSLIGPDGHQTTVSIAFAPEAVGDRERLVKRIQTQIAVTCGVAELEQRLAGPIIDGLSVDQGGRSSLDSLALPSAAVVLVLACICLRSLRAGLVVFGVSAYCQGATLALVHYAGESMSALLIVLPPLIQVLAVAGGVHLTNYYFESLPRHGPRAAALEAVRLGWLPCLLSAGTTAVGIASLTASRLTPINSFGLYASAGIVLTTFLLLVYVPAIWESWPPRRTTASIPDSQLRPGAIRYARWMSSLSSLIVLFSLAVMLIGGYSLTALRASVRIETLFAPESRILRDYRWIEDHVGPLVPIDVVVSWPEEAPASTARQVTTVWRVQESLRALTKTQSSLSAVQFLPALPPQGDRPDDEYRSLLDSIFTASLPVFRDAAMTAEFDGRRYWRVTTQLTALDEIDYAAFLTQASAAVEPELASRDESSGVSVQYTGIMPLVHEIQQQLMQDLFKSFLMALALITVMMTVSQGGLLAGLVTMIPNVFPILLLFGWLGWAGIPS
ncbi:MAG: MMPL family transporter [Planctomycetaceae bacterium]|nr:MMPL family transporter [Planctomycetaceae bacterium]